MTNEEMIATFDFIAQVAHSVNKAYCESLGDMSIPAWEEAPAHMKQSSYSGVLFRLENSNATPEDMHKNWMKDKVKDGWIYGPVKDPETKRHPCMVPYKDLPQEQRSKDYLFGATVDRMKLILLPEGE
jgi:hypothetical protein